MTSAKKRQVFQRLAVLLGTAAVVFVATAVGPRYSRVVGRLYPAPAGPVLVEVIGPMSWLHVTAWTDPDGEFLLFLVRDGAPQTLSVERPGCDVHLAEGIPFTPGYVTAVEVPPCPGAAEPQAPPAVVSAEPETPSEDGSVLAPIPGGSPLAADGQVLVEPAPVPEPVGVVSEPVGRDRF